MMKTKLTISSLEIIFLGKNMKNFDLRTRMDVNHVILI